MDSFASKKMVVRLIWDRFTIIICSLHTNEMRERGKKYGSAFFLSFFLSLTKGPFYLISVSNPFIVIPPRKQDSQKVLIKKHKKYISSQKFTLNSVLIRLAEALSGWTSSSWVDLNWSGVNLNQSFLSNHDTRGSKPVKSG